MERKPRIGKPGGVKRIAETFKQLREQTIGQEVRNMLAESAKRVRNQEQEKTEDKQKK